jgi:hypothetical protein
MSIYSQILKTLVIRPHFLYLSEQADREAFLRVVIEHNKISLESYKKNTNHGTYSNYKLKCYLLIKGTYTTCTIR